MCGIIGIVGSTKVADRLVDGLKRLEYRGYDSSGIAVLENGKLQRSRAEGKIVSLETKLRDTPLNGCLLYTSPSPRDGLLSRMPSSA